MSTVTSNSKGITSAKDEHAIVVEQRSKHACPCRIFGHKYKKWDDGEEPHSRST